MDYSLLIELPQRWGGLRASFGLGMSTPGKDLHGVEVMIRWKKEWSDKVVPMTWANHWGISFNIPRLLFPPTGFTDYPVGLFVSLCHHYVSHCHWFWDKPGGPPYTQFYPHTNQTKKKKEKKKCLFRSTRSDFDPSKSDVHKHVC